MKITKSNLVLIAKAINYQHLNPEEQKQLALLVVAQQEVLETALEGLEVAYSNVEYHNGRGSQHTVKEAIDTVKAAIK